MAKIYDLSVSLRPENMESTDLKLFSTTHEEAARILARRVHLKVTQIPHVSLFNAERVTLRSHLGTHLGALPRSHGFKVAAFPIRLEGCGASWTRAVALLKENL